ncbi:MAG: hypothetical protein RBR19_08120 [Sedimentisphaerales bacterium]|nr:hypothetical protein [Sedimentisphaerales bacterium]NLT76387.1 hypothetical protein [Planctomycetota bacterium]
MRMSVRHAVLIAAAGCFLAMTSGFVLYLHLHLAHDHDHDHDPLHHDSEHCSFCQQLLVATKDFAAQPQPVHIETDQIGRCIDVFLNTPLPVTAALNLGARAPPA